MFVLEQIESNWGPVSKYLRVPHTEHEYHQLVALLDELIEEVGEEETHPLASLMEVIGTLIEKYEDERVPELIS
ncbi:MAG: hypothetical protein Q8922_03275 [Bacteroidota bacterium]|nr:hypothetical protein [Bacteroidota bacterium]MDP4232987.1 hypothetical protein [Bacteroidota bacterium]MDP4242031.1 hypothetical protein [Bacteroidota bacterium]MDP4286934.1 hypothetical protein [Bacteroidota bacterium]